MLQQLGRRWSNTGISLEALLKEVNPQVAELVRRWELWRVAGGYIPHDSPFIVEVSPWPATGCHFEDYTAERPDVDTAVPSFIAASDNCNDVSRQGG